jgi:hypothetical protein
VQRARARKVTSQLCLCFLSGKIVQKSGSCCVKEDLVASVAGVPASSSIFKLARKVHSAGSSCDNKHYAVYCATYKVSEGGSHKTRKCFCNCFFLGEGRTWRGS